MRKKLLILGNSGELHIGAHFQRAAKELGIETKILDTDEAFGGPFLFRQIYWRLGHRPYRLKSFSQKAVDACRTFRPDYFLATGIAPLETKSLQTIRQIGICTLNYLTDDPWNPAHKASWFLQALSFYDIIFSARKASFGDLNKAGCKKVSYLPFAYAPHLHYPESSANSEEQAKLGSDVLFIGGADRDRIPYLEALAEANIKLAIYGGYWNRFPQFKKYYRGYADPATMRKATAAAKISLCLIRRANRDGNSMRTFEIPAMGGCMLAEDTEEHREIFGEEGKAVLYFKTMDQMISKTEFLLAHEAERKRLAESAHRLITQSRHTYKDRLLAMLDLLP